MLKPHSEYMRAAFAQAALAVGNCQPNPAVGAVVVNETGHIVARGFTQHAGGPHAEVMALGEAKRAGLTLEHCTMFVTLEPCCHTGRTPPCTDAIISSKISKVVIAAPDYSNHVQGRSRQLLAEKNISVEFLDLTLFEKEILFSLGWFFFSQAKLRPFIFLKWAQNYQAYLAPAHGPSGPISGPAAYEIMHRLRSLLYATMVTPGTIITDSPSLNSRPNGQAALTLPESYFSTLLQGFESGLRQKRNTMRIFLLPRFSSQFRAEELKAFLVKQELIGLQMFYFYSDEAQAALLGQWPRQQVKDYSLATLMPYIQDLGLNSLMVEAGPRFSQEYLNSGLVDGLIVFRSRNIEKTFVNGRGNSLSEILEKGNSLQEQNLILREVNSLPDDDLLVFLQKSSSQYMQPAKPKG